LKRENEFKNDYSFYNLLVEAYSNLNKYQEAINVYKQAIEINPDNSETYYNMGVALANLSEYEEVIDAFQKAIEINPDDSEAYLNLFELELILNKDFSKDIEDKFLELFKKQ